MEKLEIFEHLLIILPVACNFHEFDHTLTAEEVFRDDGIDLTILIVDASRSNSGKGIEDGILISQEDTIL